MKSLFSRKPAKDERERKVLIGLVELYLKTGKPVGSQVLKENGFDFLSPATLRNYFVKLEGAGYLKQQHSSGGRIPTSLAYKAYADTVYDMAELEEKEKNRFVSLLCKETREVYRYLQKAAEILSDWSQAAVFLSAPRFDQDFVLDVKLVGLDSSRVLCVLITDFGVIRSEVLFVEHKLSGFSLKRIEQFFHWKITSLDKPQLSQEEEEVALKLYNEVMLRHIIHHSTFSVSDILKTGFSKMLHYPDFNDASSLASGLSLFENDHPLQMLLAECSDKKMLKFWIGEDLEAFSAQAKSCAVLAVPYYVHQTVVGSLALLCPSRAPYKRLFALLKAASEVISASLTKSLYKFKISYRRPQPAELEHSQPVSLLSQQEIGYFLEDKT